MNSLENQASVNSEAPNNQCVRKSGETEKLYGNMIDHLDIFKCYKKSPYRSTKHSSYFHVYAELLEQHRGKPIKFIEVGILDGGSLFMWRDFFGPHARIVGIDLNPQAKRWEKDGFEIYIGSQSDPIFWKEVFEKVGDVDVVLDDGGHTYEHQIITAHECIPHIRNGGLLIVEDTHTSYFQDFGYPSKYSFIEWTKKLIDNINSRFPAVKVSNLPYKNTIFSISIYESIVSFKIQREKCFESVPTLNCDLPPDAKDFRYKGTAMDGVNTLSEHLVKRFPFLNQMTALRKAKSIIVGFYMRMKLKKLKRYF